MGALKGNQSGLLTAVKGCFKSQQSAQKINKGHGRIEKRTVSITQDLTDLPKFPELQTLIRVESERAVHRASIIEVSTETRYYVTSLTETARRLADRVRGYWGVENKVHYVRDVTPRAKMLLVFAPTGLFNVGQSHAILPSICIAIMAFKTWLKLNVSLALILTSSKTCLE
ncbi:ISAs1 family transposase [Microcoleus vaginatus ZQ-A4]